MTQENKWEVGINRESLKDKLTREQKLIASAKILGYTRMPPTVDEFIENEYYLGKTHGNGKMYPALKEVMMDIFPSPIHTKNWLILLGGAIGTGKSTLARTIQLYNECRLLCLKDLSFFGLQSSKGIKSIFFHTNGKKAEEDFIGPNESDGMESAFFSSNWANPSIKTIWSSDGPLSNSGIGGDVVFYNFSEINFVNPSVAGDKVETALKRYSARFEKAKGFLGNIILDSSARGDDAFLEDFKVTTPHEYYEVRLSQWDAKKHLNIYGNKGWSKVYTGDSLNDPFLLEGDAKLKDSMDPKRVILIPNELLPDFRSDIKQALMDQAGVSLKSTGKFLIEKDQFKSRLNIDRVIPEIITVDFYNPSDRIYDHVRPQLDKLPKSNPISIGLDIGVTGDLTGIAISYLHDLVKYHKDSKLEKPYVKTPVMFALSRAEGEETSLDHIQDFIITLSEIWDIVSITADTYGSRQLLQNLQRLKLNAYSSSVDRSDQSYILWKNLFLNNLWDGQSHSRFEKEVCELTHLGGIVDHPKTSDDGTPGSKDISDAVCSSVNGIIDNLNNALTLNSTEVTNKRIKLMDKINEASNSINTLLRNIYN